MICTQANTLVMQTHIYFEIIKCIENQEKNQRQQNYNHIRIFRPSCLSMDYLKNNFLNKWDLTSSEKTNCLSKKQPQIFKLSGMGRGVQWIEKARFGIQ